MRCNQSIIGVLDNENIIAYNVKFENNFEVEIINLGGVITKIITPDKDNNFENIVLGYENINDYIENPYYYGAIIGRTSGRICEGHIKIEDKEYKLNKNYGLHQGHGGNFGFNHKIWDVQVKEKSDCVSLILSRKSPHLEENYPGNLDVEVTFNIYKNYKIEEVYKCKSDKTTIVNMTNHSYFNLSGNIKRPVTDCYLKLDSDKILELDETCVPTGREINIDNKSHRQIEIGNGYDHVFLLNENKKIYMEDKISKRNMTIKTNQECVVIYTMNYEHEKTSYTGKVPPIRHGICFETQRPPIGRNMCYLEESLLKKGEQYEQKTEYIFNLVK